MPTCSSRSNSDGTTPYEPGSHGYHEGVAFYANGQRIENFPKQHSENCTAKHKATKNSHGAWSGRLRIPATL